MRCKKIINEDNQQQQQQRRAKKRGINEPSSMCFFPCRFDNGNAGQTGQRSIHSIGPRVKEVSDYSPSYPFNDSYSLKLENVGWGRLWCWRRIRVWRRRLACNADLAWPVRSNVTNRGPLQTKEAVGVAAWKKRCNDEFRPRIRPRFL